MFASLPLTFALAVIASIAVAIIGKFLTSYVSSKGMRSHRMFTPGGMPSSHSAFSTAIATSMVLATGWTPVSLAVIGFTIVIVYDAHFIRGNIDTNFRVAFPHAKLRPVGHTIAEVLVGILVGVVVPLIVFAL